MTELRLTTGYVPGIIGRVAELHARYYGEHWNFGAYFEAKVASEMSEFVKRYDGGRDGLWSVISDGLIEGSVTIDALHAGETGAQLRWFIVSDAVRGTGSGGRLMDEAMRFCREKGYGRVYLWTFAGLEAARHLYERAGFRLVESRRGAQWGTEVEEQRYEAVLGGNG